MGLTVQYKAIFPTMIVNGGQVFGGKQSPITETPCVAEQESNRSVGPILWDEAHGLSCTWRVFATSSVKPCSGDEVMDAEAWNLGKHQRFSASHQSSQRLAPPAKPSLRSQQSHVHLEGNNNLNSISITITLNRAFKPNWHYKPCQPYGTARFSGAKVLRFGSGGSVDVFN